MKHFRMFLLLLLLFVPVMGLGADGESPSTDVEETEITEPENSETEKEPAPVLRYQLAVAQADGSFSNLQEFATYDEAMAAFEASSDANAVVIDKDRKMGNGVIRMVDGIAVTAPEKAGESIFSFGTSTHSSYVNGGYDAHLISHDGENVSIALMGMEGPIFKAENKLPIDMVELIPSVQNPARSHYISTGGALRHVIQIYAFDETTNRYVATAHTINLGESPAFMEADVPYYSKDAYNYFTDPELTELAGTHQPYFKMLPIRSKTTWTAEQLDAYIASWNLPTSKMNGIGRDLKRIEDQWGINAGVLLSLAAHESGKGMSKIAADKNNLFGIGATDDNPYGNADGFYSIRDNLNYMAQIKLSEQYLSPSTWYYNGGSLGDKNWGMNVRYASDPYWGEKVVGHYEALKRFVGATKEYEIARVHTGTPVYNNPVFSGKPAYTLQNSGGAHNYFIYVLLRGKVAGGYEIQGAIDTIDENSYSFQSVGYIKEDAVLENNTVNEGFLEKVNATRLAGNNRYATAVAISQDSYAKADTVLLASGLKGVDALSAAPLASVWDAPILLSEQKTIPAHVMTEILRLEAKRVVIVGGANAIDPMIENALKTKGIQVERIAGVNRYDTNQKINARLIKETKAPLMVFIASGQNTMDALAIGGYAAMTESPIILTDGNTLTTDAMALVKGAKTVHVLGGTSSVTDAVIQSTGKTVTRTAGSNRYETALKIAQTFYPRPRVVLFTTGKTEADALTGVSTARLNFAPLVLVSDAVGAELKDYVKASQANHVYAIGGQNSVSDGVFHEIQKVLQ